jgi:hypothetical protein
VEVGEDNGAELFYYFVEAESGDTADVPFLFWLTGGGRCSVLSGLAYEIGKLPCMIFSLSSHQSKNLIRVIKPSTNTGPVRFVIELYNGTLPRLHYNQNSWSKV